MNRGMRRLGGALLVLFVAGCADPGPNDASAQDYLGKCGAAVPIAVTLGNVPPDVSSATIRVFAVDSKGKQQELKRDARGTLYFVGSGSPAEKYEIWILDGTQVHDHFPIGFQAYQGCDFNAVYDWVSGEAPTGL